MSMEVYELPKLEFTRDWNNPEDFPPVETSEEKVRADMQSLHDEAKQYLNEKLVPALSEGLGNAATKEELRESVAGQVPSGTIEKRHLNPDLANDMYFRDAILQPNVATMFGQPESASPTDVFEFLGKFNQHWWSVLHGQAGYEYLEKRTACLYDAEYYVVLSSGIKYAKGITLDRATGAMSLVDPQEMSPWASLDDTSDLEELCALAPFYMVVQSDPDAIYYVPAGVTYTRNFSNSSVETFGALRYSNGNTAACMNVYKRCTNPVCLVTSYASQIPAGETTYVCSADRNAYPDTGEAAGLTYRYLGVPYEKFPAMPKMEAGIYVGTGLWGAENPNTIKFSFRPKIVFITNQIGIAAVYIWGSGAFRYEAAMSGSINVVTENDCVMSWYCADTLNGNAGVQFNSEGATNSYVAFG